MGNVTLRCAGQAMLTEMIKQQETASSFFFIHVINLARMKLHDYTVNAMLHEKFKRGNCETEQNLSWLSLAKKDWR